MSIVAPYASWVSPLGPAQLFDRPSAPQYPCRYRGVLYWLEARAREGGRVVLMCREDDAAETCLTPEGFNIRTRVHEYGGKCFVFSGGRVIFSNFIDQRLYVQELEPRATPRPLTPARNVDGSLGMYADLQLSDDDALLVFVYERDYADRENRNAIGLLELSDPSCREPVLLVEGHDFFANPVFAPGAGELAWLQWDHPAMPWDQTEVAVGQLAPTPLGWRVQDVAVVAGGLEQSACQLAYGPDGTLYFALDRAPAAEPADDFWNLYRYRDAEVRRITADQAEYGEAHWVFGQTRIVVPDAGTAITIRTGVDGDALVRVDLRTGAALPVASHYTDFAQLSLAFTGDDRARVLMVAASGSCEAEMVELAVDDGRLRVIRRLPALLDEGDLSQPVTVNYPTADGRDAHAYFYPPLNSRYRGPADTRPPLVIFVHGGPTSRTTTALNLMKQFWTTQGYAILDINHRGSTGYGRAYRQALRGQWGIVDIADAVDGIGFLADSALVDGDRVVVRGGSAGGYAVLRLLTEYPERIRAGACYYGIGNLVTLAETTHKFEARYLDGLLGEVYDPRLACSSDSPYQRRSPIFFVDRIRSPVILFQGLDDKVVAPEVSREIVETLKRNEVAYEYVEYPGEGHGFRRSETRIDALEKEADFFAAAVSG